MIFSVFLRRNFSSRINSDKLLLSNLENLIKELRGTNSINSKVEIIKRKPELSGILRMIYAPNLRFYIKSTSINKYEPESEPSNTFESIEELLKKLSDRSLTGKAASQAVSSYLKMNPEYEDLIKCIIDKNLKARIGHDLINKAFRVSNESNIKVALGYPIEKYLEYVKKSIGSGDKWFISRKYDGIRTILVYNSQDKSLELLTRHLKPIYGLNPVVNNALQQEMASFGVTGPLVLDGELVYLDAGQKENFSKTINLVKSIDPKPIDGLEYRVFDFICNNNVFTERFKKLKDIIPNHSKVIKLVDQEECTGGFNSEEYLRKAIESEYEGFIIRKNCELKDGRSKDLLKIKPFQEDEFKVINYEIGPMRILNESIESTENVLLSITVDYKGHSVNVGSGFSVSERIEYGKEPEKIMDKIVTVRYQSESKAEGRECKSMRFPVFKALHGKKRTE